MNNLDSSNEFYALVQMWYPLTVTGRRQNSYTP